MKNYTAAERASIAIFIVGMSLLAIALAAVVVIAIANTVPGP